MSLENALEENTAALNRLTSVMVGFTSAPGECNLPDKQLDAAVQQEIENASANAPKVRKPRGPNKVKEEATPAPAVAPASRSLGAGRDEKLYKSLCDLVIEVAEKDEPRAVAIIKSFGCNRAPELKPDQIQPAIDAFSAALEELDTPADAGSSLV